MKEGSLDKIANRIEVQGQRLVTRMGKELKGIKPFATTEVKPEERLYYYETLGEMDKMELMQEFGDNWIKFMVEMEQLKSRRGMK